jgi:eukaryotic-like serine/threonine-protein kinase
MQAATSQPERLAHYDIVETLAQGHSGWAFYKGFDPILRRSVTLRAIPKRLLENYGTAMITRLQNDVGAAARLHHPGIVGVYEYGEDSEWAFIATEYAEGTCLKGKNRIPLADAVSLVVQLLGALDFAHNQGTVHRDIRPSNLLITEKGILRVANFGVAELSAGTPAYMSPEQLAGSIVDRRSDLFSAGIVFYELLAGVSPFAGPPENLTQRVCNDKERPPSEINVELPRGFDLVCAKALAKSVHERYPTARLFSDGVRDAFENAFASPPGRAVSHETVVTATLPRSQFEPASAAAPRSRDAVKAPSPVVASKWDEATLRTVEKQLAVFIGPLARIIVKEAASRTMDPEQLYTFASESLKHDDERRAFLGQRAGAQSIGQNEPSKAPLQGGGAAKPATSDPTQRTVAPEVKAAPKPVPVPKPLTPPRSVPPAKVDLNPGGRTPSKPEVPPVAQAGIKPVAKPEAASSQKPQAKPDSLPHPVPAAPDAASRLEVLIGKQPDTLAGYLHDDSPQLEEVIHAFVASVQALVAMHATDSKKEALTPQSICFDRLGKATIQNLQPTVTRGTSSGAGNPRYAAPEIFAEKISGADSTMAGAHVYALGVMFYEILLGKRLFGKTFADQRTDLDWLRWHADLESRAPQLKSLLPDYPVALSDLVESMMEKRAEKRPADLESILSRLRGIAQRANKTIVLGKTAAKAVAAKPGSKPPSTTRKKSRKGLVAILLVIVALAGGGFFLWQNPDFFRTVIAPLLHLGTN